MFLREIEGVDVENTHEENMKILIAFAGLREVCNQRKDRAEDMAEYSALRLVLWDAVK